MQTQFVLKIKLGALKKSGAESRNYCYLINKRKPACTQSLFHTNKQHYRLVQYHVMDAPRGAKD